MLNSLIELKNKILNIFDSLPHLIIPIRLHNSRHLYNPRAQIIMLIPNTKNLFTNFILHLTLISFNSSYLTLNMFQTISIHGFH